MTENQRAAIEKARLELETVLDRVEQHDKAWMDDPDRGGFNKEWLRDAITAIDAAFPFATPQADTVQDHVDAARRMRELVEKLARCTDPRTASSIDDELEGFAWFIDEARAIVDEEDEDQYEGEEDEE